MVFSIFSEISQYPYSTLVQALATLGRHCLSHPHKCMEALLFAVYCQSEAVYKKNLRFPRNQ